MLPEINRAIEQLLHEAGRIPAQEVDVRFEAPTKEWVDSLTRPTISVFLNDLRENTELRRVDFQVSRQNGRGKMQLPPRRIDLQYTVSVITTEIEDEHRLLWRTLATLMQHPHLPPEALPDELRDLDPPITTRVGQEEDGIRLPDMWTGLGVPPRPALSYIVTAPLDLERAFETPLVLTRTLRYGGAWAGAEQETLQEVGGVVRGRDGEPLAGVVVSLAGRAVAGSITDELGRFALRRVPLGSVTLRATTMDQQETTVTVTVPADSYDITLD